MPGTRGDRSSLRALLRTLQLVREVTPGWLCERFWFGEAAIPKLLGGEAIWERRTAADGLAPTFQEKDKPCSMTEI